MKEPGSGAALRTRRLIPWTLLAAEIAVGVLVVVLVQRRPAPVIDLPLEHPVAYVWMAVTVAAAVGAYLLARGGAVARYRVALAAGLSHLAAFAGIAGFYLLKIWPMLAIGGLAALAALALAYAAPATAAGPEAAASAAARESDAASEPPAADEASLPR